MRELEAIQKNERLNTVFAVDEEGPGGAHHLYKIKSLNSDDVDVNISLQKGPRKEVSSVHGVLDCDLLEIVRDRMISFQNGPFASEYNERALKGVEEALNALNDRVEDRIARNVLGKNEK